MIAFDRFSSFNYSLYDYKVLGSKTYVVRSLHKEDLPLLTKRIAYTRVLTHPQISIIKDVSLERLEGFFFDRFSAIVSQDLSICIEEPENHRIIAALFVKDCAVPADFDKTKWPEFQPILDADELVKEKFPKIFHPKICGLSANLVCFWTDPEFKDTSVPMTIATALLMHPKILTYTYVATIFTNPIMETITKMIPNSKIIEKIHFKDLKDSEGNYLYRDLMPKFEAKGFDQNSLRFSVFLMSNITPKL